MTRYLVSYDREACIGAFSCVALAPEFWEYEEDGRANLKQAQFNKEAGRWERIVHHELDLDDNEAAAESCPVNAIIVTKIDDEYDEETHDFGDWKDE